MKEMTAISRRSSSRGEIWVREHWSRGVRLQHRRWRPAVGLAPYALNTCAARGVTFPGRTDLYYLQRGRFFVPRRHRFWLKLSDTPIERGVLCSWQTRSYHRRVWFERTARCTVLADHSEHGRDRPPLPSVGDPSKADDIGRGSAKAGPRLHVVSPDAAVKQF